MRKLTSNPIHFAAKELHDMIADFGDFTSTEFESGLQIRRLKLENHPDFSLIRRMSDVDQNTTSIFLHGATLSLVVLFESLQGRPDDPDWTSGVVTIKAATMDALTGALIAAAGDECTIEMYLARGTDGECSGMERDN